jgi:hypothetical protein
LDLNYSDFYENRRQIIDDRLAQILSSPTVFDHFVAQHFDRIHSNKGMSNSSIGWHPFDSKEQLSVCFSPFREFISLVYNEFSAFSNVVRRNFFMVSLSDFALILETLEVDSRI